MELILRLNRQGTTVVMVTHSSECAGYAARRLLVRDGRLAADETDIGDAEVPKDPSVGLAAAG